ncbi:MAG: hypothetical protein U0527_06660 [Candidatus Eisenbacteria bacterium]
MLRPAPGSPSRTHAGFAPAPRLPARIAAAPRPDLAAESAACAAPDPPASSAADGDALVDLARAAVVHAHACARAFSHGDGRDAWLVETARPMARVARWPSRSRACCPSSGTGRGDLRRADAAQRGVPIGYLQGDVFGRSVYVSFNTFETFRGGGAAHVFARMLAGLPRALFGSTAFTIEPYQARPRQPRGLASGAWWFYRKLGFVPRDPATLRVLQTRDRAARARPRVTARTRTCCSGWRVIACSSISIRRDHTPCRRWWRSASRSPTR